MHECLRVELVARPLVFSEEFEFERMDRFRANTSMSAIAGPRPPPPKGPVPEHLRLANLEVLAAVGFWHTQKPKTCVRLQLIASKPQRADSFSMTRPPSASVFTGDPLKMQAVDFLDMGEKLIKHGRFGTVFLSDRIFASS